LPAATLDLTKVAVGVKYELAEDSDARAINFAAGSHTVNLNHATAYEATFDAAGTATTDSIAFTLTKTAGAAASAGALTTTDFETVTLTDASGANQTLTSADFSTSGAVSVVSAKDVTFATAVTAKSLDASGMTSTGKLSVAGAVVAKDGFITGTANNDTITVTTVGTTAGDKITINGGAGDNTITQNDTDAVSVINGGAGVDTITTNAGNDTIIAGAGNDVIATGNGDN